MWEIIFPRYVEKFRVEYNMKLYLTWTMRSFKRFLYTWWSRPTFKSSLVADSFILLTTSSWACRTLIREAFNCIEYSLQTYNCDVKFKLSELPPFFQVRKMKILVIWLQETNQASIEPSNSLINKKKGFSPFIFYNNITFLNDKS